MEESKLEKTAEVTKDMLISDVLKIDTGVAPILMDVGMHCLGCPSAQVESLQDACVMHGMDADEVVNNINTYLAQKKA